MRSCGYLGRDRQRNRGYFCGIVRGVSNRPEGSKILTFLFGTLTGVVARSYISEALMWYRRCEALSTYILGDVSSQLAEMLRKTINLSKKDV